MKKLVVNALRFLCLRDARLTALQSTQILNLSSSLLLFSRNALKNDFEELKSCIFVWQSSPECHHHRVIIFVVVIKMWSGGVEPMEPMCDHNGEACENIEHSMRSNTHSVFYTHYTFIRTSHVYVQTPLCGVLRICDSVPLWKLQHKYALCTLLIYYTYGSTIQWYMTVARFK